MTGPVEPWDWAYYAAQDVAATYDVDTNALKDYFELQRVLEQGVFFAASKLYGLSFRERHDLPVYDTDVRVFEVFDGEPDDGTVAGTVRLRLVRPPDQAGRGVDVGVRRPVTPAGTLPVVVVCLNVPKPPPGRPALMTVDEVRTAFHEFGHALHGLFSDVDYPRLQGTAVPRDFVEFPSQVNEMWAWWPEVLANYAVHHETGEPLAQDIVDRLTASRSHGQGFDTVAMLAAALLDQEWHLRTEHDPRVAPDDVEAFEAEALERHGVRSDARPTALPQRLLRPRLRRWVRRRLLLLPLERGARRRHGRLVHRQRRPDPRQRRHVPARAALARWHRRPDGGVRGGARARRRAPSR